MALPTLPDYWSLPAPRETTRSTAPRASINRATRIRDMRLRIASREAIPVIYGRNVAAPLIFAAAVHNGKLVLGLLWGAGPLQAAPTLTTRNGEALDAGVEAQHVLGVPGQVPHPWLQAALVGYEDSLIMPTPGGDLPLAYSVVRVPAGVSVDIVGEVIGPPLYNPDTDTDEYPADNPALWLLDFLSNTQYGAGQPVDWSGSVAAVQACSEAIGGSPRRWGGTMLDRPASVSDHVDALRTYAGALVVLTDDGLRLVPKRPAAVSRHITADQWIGPLSIERLPRDQRPTVVAVEYTDTSSMPWSTRTATAFADGVLAGVAPWRESRVRLTGFQSHAVAYREAVERLNHASLSVLRASGVVTDEALQDRPGDVVEVTHPDGFDAQSMRITSTTPVGPGRWQLGIEQYSALLYSDAIEDGALSVSTQFPAPTDAPAAVTGLTLDEEVYQTQSGIFATRVRMSWDASDWPFLVAYRAELWEGADLVWRSESGASGAVTSAVQEGVTYAVRVYIVGALVISAAAEDTITAQGKFLIPGDVPQIAATRIDADAVRLRWQPAIDVDIWGYEIRVGSDWESGELVDRVDALSAEVRELALGSYTYHVKAIDSVQQYSANAASVSITLTAPVAPASLDAFEVGGEARLSWPPSVSSYVQNYEIRYAAPESWLWATAEILDRTDSLRLVTKDIPAGTFRVGVRSLDRVGNVSADESTADVEVTLDDRSYLADRHFYDSPTLTNMASWTQPDGTEVYVTDSGETFGARYPNALSTYTDPMAAYQTAPASQWLSEVNDIGLSVSGNWRGLLDHSAIVGASTAVMPLSADNVTYTDQPLSVKTTARYSRLRADASSGSVLRVQVPRAETRVDVVAREEFGTKTVASSGATTVTLEETYAFANAIILTPTGTQPRQAVVDNIQTGDPTTFDIWMFDGNGAQVGGDVQWNFKGV